MKFRKKPIVIEAEQTFVEVYIATLEGTMRAEPGDWIITGVKGEKYPCKPDIFAATYEAVEWRDVFSRAWLAACKAAGIDGAQFRDIRAMAAAQGQADGIDYQALLGHSTRAMSDHYLRGRKVISAEPVRKKL